MRRKKLVQLLSVLVVVELVIVAGIFIRDSMAQSVSDVQVRQLPPQTVLYTIYRGRYDMIDQAINQLYDLARQRGLCPCGPVSIGYLNNPISVSSDHWLIEIRLPVDDSAMALAGMLGPMTDVKRLPAMKVAVAVKPQGWPDPGHAINSLHSWLNCKSYVAVDRLWQSIIFNENGDYTWMETEFMLPIEESRLGTDSVFTVRSAALN